MGVALGVATTALWDGVGVPVDIVLVTTMATAPAHTTATAAATRVARRRGSVGMNRKVSR
ncbi:hypothetical protein AAEP80_05395 [Curtobacterium sp. L3-7]|uniref:hypothetical protein n=1 Tax=Curtobacterium sp. L3-7 TaxID=3138787 RepID=UPI003B518A38